MRKTKVEVKTLYNIRFNFHDFAEIYANAKKDPCRLHAFENFNLDDTTMGNLRDCFKSLDRKMLFPPLEEEKQRVENLKYIVSKLGFDGIQWYGGFCRNSLEEEYEMTVFNNGADI